MKAFLLWGTGNQKKVNRYLCIQNDDYMSHYDSELSLKSVSSLFDR